MPDKATVFRWLAADGELNDSFRDKYTRARKFRADARFESIDEVTADVRAGKLDAAAGRMVFDAIRWQAGKENAKVYGDKVQQEVTGADGGPVLVASIDTATLSDATIAELMRARRAADPC